MGIQSSFSLLPISLITGASVRAGGEMAKRVSQRAGYMK